jgi:diguanylate cyclase (GGDEF)-like protein/PAS domain S-box-containing protein
MRNFRGIALASVGLVFVLGTLMFADLAGRDDGSATSALSHQPLDWIYVLFAGYILFLLVLFIQHLRNHRKEEAKLGRLFSVLDHVTDLIYITDLHGVIEYVNPGFEQVTGFSRSEVLDNTPRLVKSGQHDKEFYQNLWTGILRGEEFRGLLINRRKDGSLFYEDKTITPLKNKAGAVTHFISTGKDVSERVLGQEKINYLAHHDILTSLPNRAQFRTRLNEALARTRRNEKLLALLFLDLDHFKRINDSLGHDVGDALLQEAAKRLKGSLRETDSVSRIGGDEFTVILENINHVNNVIAIAQKLVYAISQPFVIGPHTLHVSVSIGITLYPLDDSEADLLIKNADMAMYHAKELGRSGFQFYAADLSKRVTEHMKLEGQLHRALEREEFVLHYQPIVDLRSGLVKSAEVLLRWQHPERGLVPPAEFIPVLEESGLIMRVTEWVLRKSLEQIQACTPAHVQAPALAVNITAGCFRGNGITKCTGNVLASYGDQMGDIVLEITESVLMHDTQHVLDLMRDLKAIGIKIALDDFGTGQSSLSHLRKFPIDIVKIDRDFVREVPDNKDDVALVSAIIAMAHGLGKKVVAEGVETESQLDFLRELGCDSIQGFLYSRPVPIEAMARLIGQRLEPGSACSPPVQVGGRLTGTP